MLVVSSVNRLLKTAPGIEIPQMMLILRRKAQVPVAVATFASDSGAIMAGRAVLEIKPSPRATIP